ncbi:free fatty acid receptor 2-like [Hoplias malabaricus]|uniref:free fatty acid receptor 2-like n=1 Tax=Hoplias malabaricus TaxID=27720 RepID=UPI0034618606
MQLKSPHFHRVPTYNSWEMNQGYIYPALAVYSITLITGLPANMLAFYTFVRNVKQKAKPMDVLLLSLTISDLIFIFFLPFRIKEVAENGWNMTYFSCTLSVFMFYTTIYNSSLHLSAISVVRYLGVAFPIKYTQLKLNPQYGIVASVLFWVISTAHCSTIIVVQHFNIYTPNTTEEQTEQNICYGKISVDYGYISLLVELFLLFFCIPFIICCFCYIRCIMILSNLPNLKPRKRRRAIGLALCTLVVFAICFMPYNMSHLVVHIISGPTPEWKVFALLPSTFNACLDPFVFYFSSSAVRGTFKSFWQGLVKRLCCCFSVLRCCQTSHSSPEEYVPPTTSDSLTAPV